MPPFSPGAHVAAYLRDSGHEEQDLSVDQQARAIRAWCEQNGLILSRTFIDEAAPGSSTVGRQAFLEMIQHFRTPGCQEAGIILWKYNRFARDIDDAQFFKADLRRRGFTIYSMNDQVPDGLDGRFFEAAIDWMNARYLEDLSVDIRRGLRDLVQQYGAMPGTPPRGFKREPVIIGQRRDGSPHLVHRWVPDPQSWDRCRTAWQMRAAGASYRQIQDATGLYNTPNNYTGFFTNRIYLGELCFADLVIPGYVPAMIDQATWDAVQARQHQHRAAQLAGPTNPDHPRRAKSSFLLSGLVHCALCGAPLNGHVASTQRGAGRYYYYACPNHRQWGSCPALKIPRDVLDDAVLASLAEYILRPDSLAARQAELLAGSERSRSDLQTQLGQLDKQLRGLQVKIKHVAEAIAEAGKSRALLEKLTSLERQEAELIARRSPIEHQVNHPPQPHARETLEDASAVIKDRLQAGSVEENRETLKGFVEKIVVEREGLIIRGVIRYYLPPVAGAGGPVGAYGNGPSWGTFTPY